MLNIKKILYWLTLIGPVCDLFIGTLRGLQSIMKAYDEEVVNQKDINQFIKDNADD